jgi:hypothetical protein
MATRSAIGMVRNDGKIVGIYCHWDGYIDYNGRLLYENYTTYDKVEELMKLGSLSSLGKEIGVKHDFELDTNGAFCTAYGRDRDEKNCEAKVFNSKKEFVENYNECWAEYFYLFDNGEWRWTTELGKPFKKLSVAVEALERKKKVA